MYLYVFFQESSSNSKYMQQICPNLQRASRARWTNKTWESNFAMKQQNYSVGDNLTATKRLKIRKKTFIHLCKTSKNYFVHWNFDHKNWFSFLFFMSETSEKICKSTFQAIIPVWNVIFFTWMEEKKQEMLLEFF